MNKMYKWFKDFITQKGAWFYWMKFDYKGYGRIFVSCPEDIQIVKNKISEIDSFEYEYLPANLITVWDYNIDEVKFVGKFDQIDIDGLCRSLIGKEVKCAWVAGHEEICKGTGEKYLFHNPLTSTQAFYMYRAGFMIKEDILREFKLDFLI